MHRVLELELKKDSEVTQKEHSIQLSIQLA